MKKICIFILIILLFGISGCFKSLVDVIRLNNLGSYNNQTVLMFGTNDSYYYPNYYQYEIDGVTFTYNTDFKYLVRTTNKYLLYLDEAYEQGYLRKQDLIDIAKYIDTNIIIQPNLYIILGDPWHKLPYDEKVQIINNEEELGIVKGKFNFPIPEDIGYPKSYYYSRKLYFKNEIGLLDYEDDVPNYLFKNEDQSTWFNDNSLIFCSITTSSLFYEAEVIINRFEKHTTIILDKFPSDDLNEENESTVNFFIPVLKKDCESILIYFNEKKIL